MSEQGWIGVDLDGTLAEYHGWQGPDHIGPPIDLMVKRVKRWLADGEDVRIFTARVADDPDGAARVAIQQWCEQFIGTVLPVTNVKDYGMIELWDDRVVAVSRNEGRILGRNLI
ncbi:MAG: hypothetical protein AB7R40_23125 [Nitrospiraceae bacterium]